MSDIISLLKVLAASVPMIILVLLNNKNNLKKEIRSRQLIMPLVALVYAVVLIILFKKGLDWIRILEDQFLLYANKLKIPGFNPESILNSISDMIVRKAMYTVIVVMNFAAMGVFMIIKVIILKISKKVFVKGNPVYDRISAQFYEENKEDGHYYLRKQVVQARLLLKVMLVASAVISFAMLLASLYLFSLDLIQIPFLPVLGILIIGELFYYVDGITKEESELEVKYEKDGAKTRHHYYNLRKIFKSIFGDKVLSDNTYINPDAINPATAEELLVKYQESSNRVIETYGNFMDKYRKAGHVLDQNYLASGLELLNGKSIHFNNPFYYDLVPYVFYAMNHKLLQHKKVLIILGRHGIEKNIMQWCEDGLKAITNVMGIWRIGLLDNKERELDVGIMTRSEVQNIKSHRNNAEFFNSVEYVVVVEPSKIISTAQIGLNSVIRFCKNSDEKDIIFCSMDKNCDGLIDALSHAFMTSLNEVSATEVPEGINSYMCWKTDDEYWQHRILPNISRYLGIGTELSLVALKNSVSETNWYGGEAFPVTDMRWIAKQYYSDLLSYAGLPTSQELLDTIFRTSSDMWSAKKKHTAYITAEDESNNLFEMKREFITRTNEESFVNIISSSYLLRDYMADNGEIFSADSKAIPYIVADYVATKRNVLLRLATQMSEGELWETDVRKELELIGITGGNPSEMMWTSLCECYNPISHGAENAATGLSIHHNGDIADFRDNVVQRKIKYNVFSGKDEVCYFIDDEDFIRVVLGDLSNVKYVAESESNDTFIGTEVRGQIFQRYLPGQFLTLCGLYYEMIDVTYDGRIRLRRAADHITERQVYRQVRNYIIKKMRSDEAMGSSRKTDKMEICRLYADIEVSTSAYWKMSSYNDFNKSTCIEINGIPKRNYNNKWLLKISFAENEQYTKAVRYTITALMNEVFRTIFAENQDMIVAVTGGEIEIPLTYSITGECELFDENSIYIIEDCQYDIGLLTAVERNITRIYQIICDYLQWNKERIDFSREHPDGGDGSFGFEPELQGEQEESAAVEKQKEKSKKEGLFKRIAEAFRRKFSKKAKTTDVEPNEGTEADAELESAEGTEKSEQISETETAKEDEKSEQISEAEKAEDNDQSGQSPESEKTEEASGDEDTKGE